MKYLFFPLMLTIFIPSFLSKQLAYISETNGKKVYTTWKVQKEKNQIRLSGEDEEEIVEMNFTKDWTLQTYHLKSLQENTEYFFSLNGKKLNVSGKYRGEQVVRSFDLTDSFPWIEHLGFGLRPFLESSKKNWKFYSVNPKDFSLVPMVAVKQNYEKIQIGTQTYKAIKIKVTLQGFKSLFWSALMWFDQKTYRLLKYEGNSGPNTPTTVVTIDQ